MKRLSFKSITLMCCMALSFGACQDIVTYNDNYDDEMASSGAPVIDAVYDSKDRDKLLPITDGNLEQSNRGSLKNTSKRVTSIMHEAFRKTKIFA